MAFTRRQTFGFAAAGAAALSFPRAGFAAVSDKRLVFVILRGGMDGLAAAPPIGDPDYVRARNGLALPAEQTLKLDALFALHPALKNTFAMAQAGEMRLVQAVATAYRDRSHFDAQNVLESGAGSPFARDSGWLNAALQSMPQARKDARKELGVALSDQTPLALRGAAPIATWAPSPLPHADEDTIARLMDLYRRTDPALAAALDAATAANGVAAASGVMGAARGGGRALAPLAKAAAGFLKQPGGPVAAVIDVTGWDTHANQGLAQGTLARTLGVLDEGLGALKAELGPAWANTVVIVATEFGRTVAMNGNGGADHGTAGAAFLLGGAIRRGGAVADWPGLSQAKLYQNRDLRPTTDLRAVLKGVLHDHLGVASSTLAESVFPDSAAVKPIEGLVAA